MEDCCENLMPNEMTCENCLHFLNESCIFDSAYFECECNEESEFVHYTKNLEENL